MRKSTLVVLILILAFPTLVGAATYTFYGGGFTTSASAYADDDNGPPDGPNTDPSYGQNNVQSFPSAFSQNPAGGSTKSIGSGWGSYNIDVNGTLGIGAVSQTSGSVSAINEPPYIPTSSGLAIGSAASATGIPDPSSEAIFFQIIASSPGETGGMPVSVGFRWTARLMTSHTSSTGVLSGGSLLDPTITLNGVTIWSQDRVEEGMDGVLYNHWFNDDGYFAAHIGDVIGIYLGSSIAADMALPYEDYSYASALAQNYLEFFQPTVEVVPLPPSALLLGSGLLGLLALRGRRRRD